MDRPALSHRNPSIWSGTIPTDPLVSVEVNSAQASGHAFPARRPFLPRPIRLLLWSLLALMTVGALFAAYLYGRTKGIPAENFHVVIEGPEGVFRSSQPEPEDLERWVEEHGIVSVINLRGIEEDEPWYRSEAKAAERLGLDLMHVELSARRAPKRSELAELAEAIRNCRRPLLIHCRSGADRAGLASAMVLLMEDSDDIHRARAQFNLFPYAHVGLGNYAHLPFFIEQYAHYRLSGGNLGIDEWVARAYRRLPAARDHFLSPRYISARALGRGEEILHDIIEREQRAVAAVDD